MSIKFLVLGGGGGILVWGGGSADFIFMGAGIFLKINGLRTYLKKSPHDDNAKSIICAKQSWLGAPAWGN